MAAVTKRILSDQVAYYLSSGYPDVADAVQREDIDKQIEQKINAMFKMQQFSINLPNGETIPDNIMLATYEDVPIVVASNVKSKSVLPVMPISLPRNAGIHEIRPVINTNGNERLLGPPFIPLISGQSYLLQADILLNDLMGQISYEPQGRSVVYSKNLVTLQITKCDMKLVVFDISQYDEFTILPIPSDMEDAVIQEVVKFFAPVQPEQGLVSNYPTPKQ
jgi:hypothetical protein